MRGLAERLESEGTTEAAVVASLFVASVWIEAVIATSNLRGDVAGVDVFRNALSIAFARVAEPTSAAGPVRDHAAS
jgi:hypothetical protein